MRTAVPGIAEDGVSAESWIRPYDLLPLDKALFDPAKAKDPLDPAPDNPRMDDPRVLEEQHRRR